MMQVGEKLLNHVGGRVGPPPRGGARGAEDARGGDGDRNSPGRDGESTQRGLLFVGGLLCVVVGGEEDTVFSKEFAEFLEASLHLG